MIIKKEEDGIIVQQREDGKPFTEEDLAQNLGIDWKNVTEVGWSAGWECPGGKAKRMKLRKPASRLTRRQH